MALERGTRLEDEQPVSKLAQLLANSGTYPYRELVQHHIRQLTRKQLLDAGQGEIDSLPRHLQPKAISFVDVLNSQILPEQDFWRTATCADGADAVLQLANEHFDTVFSIPVETTELSNSEQELAFSLFQLATLSFAYTAVDQAKAQKFMGISLGRPWLSGLALLYPALAALSFYVNAIAAGDPAPLLNGFGYGLANLGYVLLVSGVFAGTFAVFGLRERKNVLVLAAVVWLAGSVLSNLRM